MTMQDPIADMLIRLRNAQRAQHPSVTMPFSKIKAAISQVLLDEGYIESYQASDETPKQLVIKLKYYQEQGVIDSLKRVSRCGLRIYRGAKELPKVMGGLGIAIVSTPKGVMSDRQARAQGLGGEVLCYVA